MQCPVPSREDKREGSEKKGKTMSKENTTSTSNTTAKNLGFLQPEIIRAEHKLDVLNAQNAEIDKMMSAITSVDYRWVNRLVKTTKTGKITDKSSRAILSVTLNDGRKVDFVDYSREIGAFTFFNEFTTVFGPDDVKIAKVALLQRLSLPVSDGARAACDKAMERKLAAAEKRTARDKKTFDAGREAFLDNKAEAAKRAWDRLEERLGL